MMVGINVGDGIVVIFPLFVTDVTFIFHSSTHPDLTNNS